MKRKNNLMMTAISLTVGLSLLTGCNSQSMAVTTQTGDVTKAESENIDSSSHLEMMTVSYDEDDHYTAWQNETYTSIQLNKDTAQVDGTGAVYDNGTLTITQGGIYLINGELSDGSIAIDSEDKEAVRIILNGASIHSSTTAPFNVINAEKVVVSLEEGTTNTFSDGANYVYEAADTDEPDATIFSKDDLIINGTGTLNVEANYKNGITSKDDLKIMEGTINVTSVNHSIKGKDMVAIKDGIITITAGGDGIKATNDTDTEKGFVNIEGGAFNITAAKDGIQGETNVQITDGQFEITTNGGSSNGASHMGEGFGGMGGKGPKNPGAAPEGEGMKAPENAGAAATNEADTATDTESDSYKGIKAGNSVFITGGEFVLNTADDSIHSNNNLVISSGTMTIESGDDGLHSDNSLAITGGTIEITKSYEGIESSNITFSGGNISITASDDGVNVCGESGSSKMGRPGENTVTAADETTRMLIISGGNITVDASGDGLDSNGNITMTGGTVFVSGPTNNGNGTLDYDGEFLISGGTLIAAGSSGMLQATSTSSKQAAIVLNFSEGYKEAGTLVNLQDSQGNTIVSLSPEKTYQSVVISSPDIVIGNIYTLSYGGSDTGTLTDGVYVGGAYSGGTSIGKFTVSDTLTYLCETGVTTAPQGGMGRGNGGHSGKMDNRHKMDTTQNKDSAIDNN